MPFICFFFPICLTKTITMKRNIGKDHLKDQWKKENLAEHFRFP